MRKPKYNQGDIAQYTNMDGSKELLVITEVLELPNGMSRYSVHWLGLTEAKGRCKISTLDDNPNISLFARGQQNEKDV
jgi:hypothetical protein